MDKNTFGLWRIISDHCDEPITEIYGTKEQVEAFAAVVYDPENVRVVPAEHLILNLITFQEVFDERHGDIVICKDVDGVEKFRFKDVHGAYYGYDDNVNSFDIELDETHLKTLGFNPQN